MTPAFRPSEHIASSSTAADPPPVPALFPPAAPPGSGGRGKRVRLRRSVAKPSAGGARSRRRDSARPSGGPGATRAGAEPAFQGTGHGRRPGTLERKARRGRRAEPARSATTAPAPRDRGAVAQGGMDKRGGSADGRGPLRVFGAGGPRPAKRTPAQWSPRAPGSCADAIRTYCATPPRWGEEPPHRKPRPAGRGCVGGVPADRTHNAPYGRGAGRAAGGVTCGGSPAPAGMFAGFGESLSGGGGAEPPGAAPCEASAVEFLWLRGGRVGVDWRPVPRDPRSVWDGCANA